MTPEQEDEQRMAEGFGAALEITEGIVDEMAETFSGMALRIAEETSINFDGDASSNEWLIDFARRLRAEMTYGHDPEFVQRVT